MNKEIIFTEETREPSTTIACNLKEQIGSPWVFKAGKTLCEEIALKAQKMHDDRKGDWMKTLSEFIIQHTAYSPNPEDPFGFSNLRFEESIQNIFEAFRKEYRVALDKPKQATVAEAAS